MVVNPKIGSVVQVWYRAGVRDSMPFHGKIGVVFIASKNGKPRNHAILIDGELVCVPCGNLRKIERC